MDSRENNCLSLNYLTEFKLEIFPTKRVIVVQLLSRV